MKKPRGLPQSQAEITAAIDAEIDALFLDGDPVDKRESEFRSFIFKTKPGSINTATNRLIQAENANLLKTEMETSGKRSIFQRAKWSTINLPLLWSPQDEERAKTEGWAIGRKVSLPNNAFPGGVNANIGFKWVQGAPCIGKATGTFTSDEDAHEWVVAQGRQSDKWSVYNRALAVIAAMTITDGANG